MLGAPAINSLFLAIRSAFNVILTWLTSLTTELVVPTGALHSLLPLFAIGISIAAVLVAIAIIRRIMNA